MKTLSPSQAKEFYDQFGEKQDKQGYYEDRAVETLLKNSLLQDSTSIFEFGCGTGRIASDLLNDYAPRAEYLGMDISETMIQLAEKRLERFHNRTRVQLSPGGDALGLSDKSVDRFISTYVFDLLPEDSIRKIIAEAKRILEDDGLICLVGITAGRGILSRCVMGVWRSVFALKPSIVGGCRPIRFQDYFSTNEWDILYNNTVVSWGVASDVFVARPM